MAGMSQRTSLVHPSTAKLDPDNQAKGNYTYTSPLVLAYLRGEELNAEDMRAVVQHYQDRGTPLPQVKREEPALAEQKGVCWGCIEKDDRMEHTCKKVVRKVPKEEKPPRKPLEEIVAVAVSCYTPLQKEALFKQLASELGYSVE